MWRNESRRFSRKPICTSHATESFFVNLLCNLKIYLKFLQQIVDESFEFESRPYITKKVTDDDWCLEVEKEAGEDDELIQVTMAVREV